MTAIDPEVERVHGAPDAAPSDQGRSPRPVFVGGRSS